LRLSTRLSCICIDANDIGTIATFWAGALGWRIGEVDETAIDVFPPDKVQGPPLVILPVPEKKTTKNRIHFDLVSESVEHQSEMVDRFIALGASHTYIGQPADADHVVLADPEGNEFCVVLRSDFLATTGLLGAVAFEPGNPAAGYFWSEAVGWPLVYDQDGETAIRAPDGKGPFITFGPPGNDAKAMKNRLHLDIAPPAHGDQAAEVERLISLGAKRVDIGQGDVSWVVMADPDGNEFCVLTPR
jgi:hypothetical protein